MADMTVNLDKELGVFTERIRTDGSVRVTRAEGYSGGGGGATDALFVSLLILLQAAALRRSRA